MIVIVIYALIFGFPTWLFMSGAIYDGGYKSRYGNTSLDEDRTKTNWNAIALTLNAYEYIINVNWRDIFYPTTGIDKEIAEEEKEIAELERQKEKMNKLEELKRRKERLFSDVHIEELWECTACGDEFETLRDYGRHVSEAHHS